MPSDLPEQLRQRALSLPDGNPESHASLGRLSGVDALTDGLLVLMLAAVEERVQLSGKAHKRVLARLLIVVMGSQVSLSSADADRVGARLHAQACKVRGEIEAVVEDARCKRQQAAAAAEGDDVLAAALASRLEQVAAGEQAELDILRLEVYEAYDRRLQLCLAIVATPGRLEAHTLEQATLPLPRWLQQQLGLVDESDAIVKYLLGTVAAGSSDDVETPVEWPAAYVECPEYVQRLLRAFQSTEYLLKQERAKVKYQSECYAFADSAIVQEAQAQAAKALEAQDQLMDDVGELRSELERAKGREEGLQKAVERAHQLVFDK